MAWKFLAIGAAVLIGREVYLQSPRAAPKELEEQITTEVVTWHGVYYDTMEQFDVDHGTSFVRVEYPVGWSDTEEIVEITVKGRVHHRDTYMEKVRKRCVRGDSTRLSDKPITPDEDNPDMTRDPVCFVQLDHKQEYARKPKSEWVDWDNEITASTPDEFRYIMGAVSHPIGAWLTAEAKVAARPPRWQRGITEWAGAKLEALGDGAERFASWFERS